MSLNRRDVRCRISGLVRAADGSPCYGERRREEPLRSGPHYTECGIWRAEKVHIWESPRTRKATRPEKMIAPDGSWKGVEVRA